MDAKMDAQSATKDAKNTEDERAKVGHDTKSAKAKGAKNADAKKSDKDTKHAKGAKGTAEDAQNMCVKDAKTDDPDDAPEEESETESEPESPSEETKARRRALAERFRRDRWRISAMDLAGREPRFRSRAQLRDL